MISVSLYTHLYAHKINKLLHGWFVCTIFVRTVRSLYALTNHEVISISLPEKADNFKEVKQEKIIETTIQSWVGANLSLKFNPLF